jgi:ferredoxin--NADP+ reductase
MSYRIVSKERLAYKMTLMRISAPEIAAKAQPGQFLMIISKEGGERVPLTICDYDAREGTIAFAFHEVGKTTKELGTFEAGDELANVTGPLGKPSEIARYGKVLVVGGSIMAAPALLQAKAMRAAGNSVTTVLGCRAREFLIMEEEARKVSDDVLIASDDGSIGERGIGFLDDMLGKRMFDRCVVMGPVVMMKDVCEITKRHGVPTIVTLTPIMIDGMGMCGACRVTVDGKRQFGCVDGPEFDGHKTDLDELIKRQRTLLPEERLSSMLWEAGKDCSCRRGD